MKTIRLIYITLFFLALGPLYSFAQKFDYEREWKKIEVLVEKEGRPQSALQEVKKIYTQAGKENNQAQMVRALVYMSQLQESTRENNLPLSISEIESEIRKSTEPATSILKSFLAGKYLQYFNNNRWKFYQRSETISFLKTDISTWSAEDFHKKISSLYLESIQNEKLLKQTRLDKFEPIIKKGNARSLRPTLYDLLAHQAISYFRNDERSLRKPAYAFEIDQPEAFSPAKAFAAFNFRTRDSLSLHHKALLIYQELIRFHLDNQRTEALVDVDIERLQFVNTYSTHPDKTELYKKALEQLIQAHNSSRLTYQAQYLLAQHYNSLAHTYHPDRDTTYRFERIKARNILQKIVADSAVKNEGWTNSYNLLNQITQVAFSFEMEKVNLPAKPFRVLVHYNNIEKLHFRIIKVNADLRRQMERGMEDRAWNAVLRTASLKQWEQALPATGDLQQHRVEVKVDALTTGEYILIASSNNQFRMQDSKIGIHRFSVSNLSYVNSDNAFFVLHRETGEPLKNVKAEVYERVYNYKENRYTKQRSGSHQTDAKGFFTVTRNDNKHSAYLVTFSQGKDTLEMDEGYYTYYNNSDDTRQPEHAIFFFTDRSIYRPGQLVQFKGIVLNKKDGSRIIPGYKTRIYLFDANYQAVDSVELTSGEFGSFSGKFQLPSNVLTGSFFLREKPGINSMHFLVEEYKRPNFFIDYDKIKESYAVEQKVEVTGTAKAYAGNTISGAKLVYRVIRQPRFIYPRPEWRSWLPASAPMEITSGETVTDNNGKFSISFTAIPDKKIDPKFDPLFDYIVYTDITDINGETRSAEKRITAGYKSLMIQTSIPSQIHKDSLRMLTIRTENLNGEFQHAMVNVKFTALLPENRLIRKRYWQKPDQFVMTKEEYLSYFPNDEYNNEKDPSQWKKAAVAFNRSDSTSITGNWFLNSNNIPSGYYEVEITTKDKDGKEVKYIQVVEVFENNKFNAPEYFVFRPASRPIEPGESTSAQAGSSAGIFLVRYIDRSKNSKTGIDEKNLDQHSISNNFKNFNYTASEADRGGYGVTYFFVKDNRVYQAADVIVVPWTNKELDISYASFRDKTLPGSEEKWKLTIKGYRNEKAAVELLASMYDASLDQFMPHQWFIPDIYPRYNRNIQWNGRHNFSAVTSLPYYSPGYKHRNFEKTYDRFIFDQEYGLYGMVRGVGVKAERLQEVSVSAVMDGQDMKMAAPPAAANLAEEGMMRDSAASATGGDQENTFNQQEFQVRKNFNETAFFFPHLMTDAEGNIEISFTIPEALTRWKFLALAHNKDLAFGISKNEVVTQKELMVQTNAPRFLRQGDRIEFTTKIANLSEKEITGQVQLLLLNANTGQTVDGWFMNSSANQYFTVAAGASEMISFPLQVPFEINEPVTWRIVAASGNYSDGEENILPVLSNKVLVTETLPLNMKGDGKKDFNFERLKNATTASSLEHHALTIEYTANPAWFAVQALPYLSEYPNESADQVWNMYYANALASRIANSSPKLKAIFEKWRNTDTAALISNLQKNQELKNILLEETPWVLAAKTETEQRRNIALLFDLVKMNEQLKASLEKLKSMQGPNGGFVWFKGGPDDRYITQNILTGIGHLSKLGVDISPLSSIISSALPYLDKKIKEDHDALLKSKVSLEKQQPGYIQIQYLYMRSFFKTDVASASRAAYNFYTTQASKFWVNQNQYMKGMIALALHRKGDLKTPGRILVSLKETSINDEELGRYWKDVRYGKSWYWWHAPIETQSLLIEAFSEIAKDQVMVDEMKTWLVRNKQTTHWKTTKATADACYAMLLQGTNWLSSEPSVTISVGNTVYKTENLVTEAGTGYFKQRIEAKDITPSMGNISVTVKSAEANKEQPGARPSWGAVYWQYFQDMDKVESAATPLKLNKKLFVVKNSDRGPVLTPVTAGMELNTGDKITVRVELSVDRDMEYVHMKDMRASSLEPVNVLSGYKWQGGLGYYESTRDASTNFFFSYLPKGSYVFEYSLFVTHKGNFSNGITTIQSYYAPEFSAHSEGVKIRVD